MPKKVGTVHSHMLPSPENQEVGSVWSCDCGTLFYIVPGGHGDKERQWNLVTDISPAFVDYAEVEPVTTEEEEKAGETEENQE